MVNCTKIEVNRTDPKTSVTKKVKQRVAIMKMAKNVTDLVENPNGYRLEFTHSSVAAGK